MTLDSGRIGEGQGDRDSECLQDSPTGGRTSATPSAGRKAVGGPQGSLIHISKNGFAAAPCRVGAGCYVIYLVKISRLPPLHSTHKVLYTHASSSLSQSSPSMPTVGP